MNKSYLEFPVVVYGNLEKFNDVLSKARCRIFYKYGNRNGTYITDEFAEKLVNTLHYVPVKGIYNEDEEDYTDHGILRSEGRIYGIVPETNNFAWEPHLDEDGVERIYACTDVLIFTALYEEAGKIVGKSQSMELFAPNIEYHYEFIQGQKWVVFDEGCFLGLQVLGDDVEPCFEGAAFYSLQQTIQDTMNKIDKYVEDYQNSLLGGQEKMPIFKLSDRQKFEALWSLLNEEYSEECGYVITYSICDVFEDYALVYNYETCSYERAYYTKNDENDSVVINAKKKCYVLDVTEEEKDVLDTLHKLNGETYELVNEDLLKVEEIKEENSNFSAEISKLQDENVTLNTEKEKLSSDLEAVNTEYANAQSTIEANNENISNLESQIEELTAYKVNIETNQKNEVINEYTNKLSDEILDSYREKVSDFSIEDLDKELAYELKKSNPSAFNSGVGPVIPKQPELTGIDAYLEKYVIE